MRRCSAYDFTVPNEDPTPIPSIIDGTTYPVTFHDTIRPVPCKAASVKELSGQKVTLTVAGSQPTTTTEIEWNYENGFIMATGATIIKLLYTDPVASTTSTCFGERAGCPTGTNPLLPTPTSAPSGQYIPPPSAALTQFTPSPSCLAASNFWLVSGQCSAASNPRADHTSPPWLQCTHTVAGDPDPAEAACHPRGPGTAVRGTPAYYTTCPVGYTVARAWTDQPFDATPALPSASWQTRAVDATGIACCPSAVRGVSFAWATSDDHPLATATTVHDGVAYTVTRAALPGCFATGRAAVAPLDGRVVTLGLYSDAGGYDPSTRTPGRKYERTTEAVWDAERDVLFAYPAMVRFTVFHGPYTCFRGCEEYFTYSYHNTLGSGEAQPTGALEGGEGGAASTSTGAAAAVTRGDVQAGLSVVVVVVTVFHAVLGALV